MKKRDDGIAKIQAKMSDGSVKEFEMREEIRDALNKKALERKFFQEENRTIPNYDRMSTQELEACKFSGFRLNEIARRIELWVGGMIACTEPAGKAARNPAVLADMHERAFATIGSLVDVDLRTEIEPPATSKNLKH